MRDAENAVIREKFIALNAYIRKERSKINNLSFHHHMKQDKEQHIKNKYKEEIISRAETNETDKETIKKKRKSLKPKLVF